MQLFHYISPYWHQLRLAIIVLFMLSTGLLAGQTVTSADSTQILRLIEKAASFEQEDSIRDYLQGALTLSYDLPFHKGVRESLRRLSEFELAQENTSNALGYALESNNFLIRQADSLNLYDAYMHTGAIYQHEALYLKALEYYKLALGANKQLAPIRKCQLQELVGQTFTLLEEPELDSALVYFQKVHDFHETKKDTAGLVKSYENSAAVFHDKGDHQKALDCHMEILALLEKTTTFNQLATIYNNIGYHYNFLKDYQTAISYFLQTLQLSRNDETQIDLAVLHTNLGIAYNNLGEQQNAIKHFLDAQKKLSTTQTLSASYLYNLIANTYLNNGDLYNALRYNELAIEQATSKRQTSLLSNAYRTGAEVHQGLYNFEQALVFYQLHLNLRDSMRLEERLRQQSLLQQQYLLERSEKEIKLLLVSQEISDLTIGQLELEKDKLRLESDNLKLTSKQQEDELALLRRNQEIEAANLKNKELETQQTKQDLRLAEQQLLAVKQDREISDLQQREQLQELELARGEAEKKEKEREIEGLTKDKELLTKEQEINQLELERQETFRQFVYGLGALIGLILIMILSGLIYFKKANERLAQKNRQIEEQKQEIEGERNKSEQLLLNILPEKTAQELKDKGYATPRQYPKVSVLFTDFRNFTSISANMSPEELIEELNIYFQTFDEIIDRHGLEKIKTIGDAYMCAGGIPVDNETNPIDAVKASLEMKAFVDKRAAERQAQGLSYWQMRIGIHTGKVIAGVVGSKKFAYDIWGDTVNTASRLESNSEAGRINISAETYQLVEPYFDCTYRGKIAAKNKGEINMYFVENEKH